MKIQDLIRFAENKLQTLNGAMTTAMLTGDIEQIERLQREITDTEQTLTHLRAQG